MAKSKITSLGGLVYSTDPNFKPAEEIQEQQETLLPAEQKLKVRLDTKQRAGKAVTIVSDFIGKDADREELGKKLKTFCGTGGAVKGREIIVQGDNKEKVLQWLHKNGYSLAKKN